MFRTSRLGRSRAGLAPQHRVGVLGRETAQYLQGGGGGVGLEGVSIPLFILQMVLEHVLYTRSWGGIAHGTHAVALPLTKIVKSYVIWELSCSRQFLSTSPRSFLSNLCYKLLEEVLLTVLLYEIEQRHRRRRQQGAKATQLTWSRPGLAPGRLA